SDFGASGIRMNTPEFAFGSETLYTTRNVALPIFDRVYQRSSSGLSGKETRSPFSTLKPGGSLAGAFSCRGIRAHPLVSLPLNSCFRSAAVIVSTKADTSAIWIHRLISFRLLD